MQITEIALAWIEKNLTENNWPEDDWIGLDENHDLNIYLDENEKGRASIYSVVDGSTKVDTWIQVI